MSHQTIDRIDEKAAAVMRAATYFGEAGTRIFD
jgi:hypothetical protein